jgi:hypothetical protein
MKPIGVQVINSVFKIMHSTRNQIIKILNFCLKTPILTNPTSSDSRCCCCQVEERVKIFGYLVQKSSSQHLQKKYIPPPP